MTRKFLLAIIIICLLSIHVEAQSNLEIIVEEANYHKPDYKTYIYNPDAFIDNKIYWTIKSIEEAVDVAIDLKKTVSTINREDYSNYLKVYKDRVEVFIRYNSNSYMCIRFRKGGVNSIMGIGEMYLVRTNGSEILGFTDISTKSIKFNRASTDWISPYIVRAIEGPLGKYPKFTGGWHGGNGDRTGRPTGKTVDYRVIANGKEITEEKVIKARKIEIIVRNHIQGYNTKEEDGMSRDIVEEVVRYTINENKINVNLEILALEDIVIERYYGLQTYNLPWNGTLTYGDSNENIMVFTESNSGKKSINPDVNFFTITSRDGEHQLQGWLDSNKGLGNLEFLSEDKPIIFTRNYGKTYFNLINGIIKPMKKNEKANWSGGYRFKNIE